MARREIQRGNSGPGKDQRGEMVDNYNLMREERENNYREVEEVVERTRGEKVQVVWGHEHEDRVRRGRYIRTGSHGGEEVEGQENKQRGKGTKRQD